VTVTINPEPVVDPGDLNFLSFSFPEEAEDATINSSEFSIFIKVYNNSDLSSLTPNFTVSDGAIVKIGDVVQESGVTTNDYSQVVTYTIISKDGSTSQNWLVSVIKNTAPIAIADNFEFQEDSFEKISLKVLENDYDADDDPIVIKSITLQSDSNGVWARINDNKQSIDLEILPNYYGEIIINYIISDGYEMSNESEVLINITPDHNDAPVARDDTITLFINSDTVNINVLANDYDPDNLFGETIDFLELMVVVSSERATISISEDKQSINYKPSKDFFGVDEVTYIVTDGNNNSVGKLLITINNESMELLDIYKITYSPGSGGTNGHHDFGIKSYDIFSDMLSGDMALSQSVYGWYKTSITEFGATQDFTRRENRQVWNFYFGLIKRCNFLIDKIDQKNAEINDDLKHVLGQTKALRAYSYFYLTQFFQNEYNPNKKILPILLNYNDNFQELQEASALYDLIEEDLNHAITLLDGYNRNNKSQINKPVAQTILAYALASKGDYAGAYTQANDVITNGGFTPMQGTELTGGFNQLSTPGWMWGIDLNTDTNVILLSFWGQVDYFSYSYAAVGDYKAMDQNLFNQMPANDSRKAQFYNNPASALNLLPINKFYNPRRVRFGGDRPTQDDIFFYRISEVHLLAAECAAKSGNEARAKTILKNFMSLRVPDASYVDGLSGTQLTNHIYLQTRLELWGEGKSYLAMKRNKATITRGPNHLSFVGVAIPYNDDRLTFEIPEGFGFTPNDPVITLIGDQSITIPYGTEYNDLGAIAKDKDYNDISDRIIITHNIDPNKEGDYTVKYNVTDTSGRAAIQMTRKVTVSKSLSLNENNYANLSIFPNPVNNILYIRSEEQIKKTSIISITGRVIFNVKGNIESIDLSRISNGAYLILIETDNGSFIKKILKN